jgi:hypothetical protein
VNTKIKTLDAETLRFPLFSLAMYRRCVCVSGSGRFFLRGSPARKAFLLKTRKRTVVFDEGMAGCKIACDGVRRRVSMQIHDRTAVDSVLANSLRRAQIRNVAYMAESAGPANPAGVNYSASNH